MCSDTLSELSTDVPSSRISGSDDGSSLRSSSAPSELKIARVVEQLRALKLGSCEVEAQEAHEVCKPASSSPKSQRVSQQDSGLEVSSRLQPTPTPSTTKAPRQDYEKACEKQKKAMHNVLPPNALELMLCFVMLYRFRK